MTLSPLAPVLVVRKLSHTFPASNDPQNSHQGLQVLDRLTFSVYQQEFVCVLGPSGSGKSTLLRILGGLLQPTRGKVIFEGRSLVESHKRMGFVFQNANLMPWRSVLDNITLPLEMGDRVLPRDETVSRAMDLIELVGLSGFERALPRDLSGGMAQRVTIARALVHDPDILLLDEPFGALDALTRERMGMELLRIWHARRKTVVMVTHSIPEALFLADRVLVLTSLPGRIQLDMPVELPRPREEDVRYTPAFGDLARQVRAAIGEK